MRDTFIPTPARPLDELGLCRWIGQAAPEDVLEYHRGHLAIDVATLALGLAEQRALRRLALRARWAFDAAFVHLVQRRVGPDVFAYLAIKRRRGFTAPPAIDPDGGEVRDLWIVTAAEAVAA